MKVQRRSGEHNSNAPWSSQEICVCTPAMLLQGFKMKQIDVSQISLLVFDEVHEANSPKSIYGLIMPFIAKCQALHRPRVLALTASPSGTNTTNIRECIYDLCNKLNALPFSPLVDDEKNSETPNGVNCEYIEVFKTSFELRFEEFVFETIESLSLLDEFFVSNWQDVPKNVAARLKVSSIEKVLSHSEGQARHSNNVFLFQLTMFMKKWLHTLDLLQIFGPRKLLQFIKSDLDFSTKNDSISKILPQLTPLLNTFRAKILGMESSFFVSDESSRISKLIEKLLQHQSEQARILIFVERRDTAERLSRRLQEDAIIGKMNPAFVVGNSGNCGLPKERQQEIMERFRSGECQLLVATSVLEQGIDVAACNVVICFDGVKSIKSIIQSRGRARKKAANFIVFVSSEGRNRINEMTQLEVAMDLAIRQLMHEKNSKFEANFSQEIEKFLEGDRDETLDRDEIEDDDDDEELFDEETETDCVFLRFFNFNDQHALADHISSFFITPNDRLKMSKNFIVARFAIKDGIREQSKIIRVS